jgi:outer membrane protein OmpA-like peptidoglycan-associated protein
MNVQSEKQKMISADVMIIKDFSKLTFFNFEPFVEFGAGQSFVESEKDYFVNVGVGVHYPLSEKVAIKLNSSFRKNFMNDAAVNYVPNLLPHFQHNLGISINFGGKDTDQDGIYDQHDDCPQQPGLPEFNGCPDNDGDGIENSKDACPDTPGLLEFNGCADSDGDGIADPMDKCPNVAGLSKFGGCPDTDGDGIEDAKDACPETAGLRRFRGCPDSDGDGIADPQDKCPNDFGPSDNEGCPNPTAEAIDKLNNLGAVVQFELNKSNIKPSAYDILMAVYDLMSTYGNTNFLIEGHTDTSGPKAFNNKLSLDRANKVKSHLIDKGVDSERLSTVGYGEDKPKESNNTRKGRIANRRVEFKVVE